MRKLMKPGPAIEGRLAELTDLHRRDQLGGDPRALLQALRQAHRHVRLVIAELRILGPADKGSPRRRRGREDGSGLA